jgi:hypothetical protein
MRAARCASLTALPPCTRTISRGLVHPPALQSHFTMELILLASAPPAVHPTPLETPLSICVCRSVLMDYLVIGILGHAWSSVPPVLSETILQIFASQHAQAIRLISAICSLAPASSTAATDCTPMRPTTVNANRPVSLQLLAKTRPCSASPFA